MRAGRNPITILAFLLEQRLLISSGIIRIEVLRGIIKDKPKTQIIELFRLIPEIPIDNSIIVSAIDTAWELDRQGQVLPVTDILIASCAKQVGATVLTEDAHFEKIPDLKVQQDL
jgi:hypothetical protein